jgi:hypothetical protein
MGHQVHFPGETDLARLTLMIVLALAAAYTLALVWRMLEQRR